MEFVTDLSSIFAPGVNRPPFFGTSNRCIPVKKYIRLKCSRVLCVRDRKLPLTVEFVIDLSSILSRGKSAATILDQ